jgi:hypothetical protein
VSIPPRTLMLVVAAIVVVMVCLPWCFVVAMHLVTVH